MSVPDTRWNLNIHYHRVVLGAVPPHARSALDVGCGDGLLSFDLADRGLQVVGIDRDTPSIERARLDLRMSDRVRFVIGDVLTDQIEPSTFDVVGSISMLHHVDAAAGLRRLRELVAPGGVLAIVSFARPSSPLDHGRAIGGALYKRAKAVRHGYWEHHAPVQWPPAISMRQVSEIVRRELPGASFRPLLASRYAVVWHRPAAPGPPLLSVDE